MRIGMKAIWACEDETAWQSQGWDEWQDYDEYGYFPGKGKKGKKGKGKGKKGHGPQDQGKGQGDGKGKANYVNPSHSSQQKVEEEGVAFHTENQMPPAVAILDLGRTRAMGSRNAVNAFCDYVGKHDCGLWYTIEETSSRFFFVNSQTKCTEKFRVQAYGVVLLCLPLNTFFEDTFPKTQFGQGGA